MNKIFVGILLGLLIGAAGTWLALRSPAPPETAKAEHPATTKPEEKDHPLHFPPAKRTAAGITLATPTESTLTPETAAFGRVLDPSPLFQLSSELITARAAGIVSEKERERSKKLRAAGGNASEQAVELAEANAARDAAAISSAQARLTATWGRALATDFSAVEKALAEGASLIRLDVLLGDAVSPQPKTARVNAVGNEEAFDAEILGPVPSADAQVAGAGFIALLRGPSLPVGAALHGLLPGMGETKKALVVSRDAIVYHQGSAWAFVLGEEDTFERKLVSLGRSVGGDRVAVDQGLTADEQVVVTGAQQLLAAELQAGGAPAED